MNRKHFIHVLKFPDGRFLDKGYDCADRFVHDPLDASNMSVFNTEADTNEYRDEGAILVQYEISATPTGITCADIFKIEREQAARHEEEQREIKADIRRFREAEEAEHFRLVDLTFGITGSDDGKA